MKQYKVWIHVEEIDEEHDHYADLDLPFGGVATYGSAEQAIEFAERLQDIGQQLACQHACPRAG